MDIGFDEGKIFGLEIPDVVENETITILFNGPATGIACGLKPWEKLFEKKLKPASCGLRGCS